MADAVNAPENKPEVVEALSHGATSVEETGPGQTALPVPALPANPKSPTELREDKAEDSGDLEVIEPPEKKARKSLEEEMGKIDGAHQRRLRPYCSGVGQGPATP